MAIPTQPSLLTKMSVKINKGALFHLIVICIKKNLDIHKSVW